MTEEIFYFFLLNLLWLRSHCYADCCLSVLLLSVTQLIIHCHIVPTNNGSVFVACSTEIWFTDQWARWFCLTHNEVWWDCDKLMVKQWQQGVFCFTCVWRFSVFLSFCLCTICKNKTYCSQTQRMINERDFKLLLRSFKALTWDSATCTGAFLVSIRPQVNKLNSDN